MIYGSRLFKNGKERGYLEFTDGKRIILKDKYKKEFDLKLREIEFTGELKERYKTRLNKKFDKHLMSVLKDKYK